MLDFEQILELLHDEGLQLSTVEQSNNAEVLHSIKGKKNQESLRKFTGIRKYLESYPLQIIEDDTTAEKVIAQVQDKKLLGIDIETSKKIDHDMSGLIPTISHIRLVQIFDGETIYIFDQNKIKNINWIAPLKDTHLIAHNAFFEAHHFNHYGIVFNNLDCSMLMGRVFLNENISLANMAKDAFGLELDKSLQVSNWAREELLPEQVQYAALDAVITYQLNDKFAEWFADDDAVGYTESYQFLKKLMYPMVRQQKQGILIDTAEHTKIINKWQTKIVSNKKLLAEDGLLNPKSVKQKQEYLKSKLSAAELDSWPTTAKGGLSTKSDHLLNLESHPILGVLAEYTKLSAYESNFGTKLQGLSIDNKVYPSYQIARMVSGRYGCTSPNFQNQPRSGFKHIYIAPEGYSFVTGDLAQVELRVAGLLSEDAVINKAYATGKDLHRLMASKMTGKPEADITKAERTAAKGVNFGLLFGGGAKGLQQYVKSSYGVDMSLEEAKFAKQAFHTTYKNFTFYQQAIVKHTNKYDVSESQYSGLKRHYTNRDHYFNGQYKDIYTHAINYPVQSSAWEILALAIIYVDENAPDGVRISHHVYDELCLVCPEDQTKETAYLLRDAFRYGYQRVFPGCNMKNIIEVGSGKNWAEAGSDENIIELDN